MAPIAVSDVVLLVAVISSGLIAYISRSREVPAATGLTVTSVGVCLSMTTYLFFPSAFSETPPPFVDALSMTAGTMIVGGWMYLSAKYTDTDWLVDRYRVFLLVAPLLAITGLHLAGSVSPLVSETVRSWLPPGTFTAFAYTLVGLSLVLLAHHLVTVEPVHRRQTGFLIVAPLAPLLTAELYQYNVVPLTAEMTPIGYIPTLVLTLYALRSHQLLDIIPMARETAVNNIEDAIISVTADDVIASINEPGKELLGVTDDVVGEEIADALAEWPSIHDAVAAGEERQVAIGPKYVRVVVTPIENDGTKRGYVIHLRDITYEVQRRQELRRKQQQLETKNEQLDEFASVVSHDIRNPLNVAQGQLEMIAPQVDDQDSIAKISRAHDRIENIVNSLLSLAKNGQQVDSPERTAFRTIVERARVSAGVAPEALTFEGPEEIRADPSRLQQLLENLFRNSIQHGGTDVSIRVGPLAEGPGFFVADDGPGIDAKDREDVFEYGYTDSTDGTGFGLNIVKTIVEAHDWSVDLVESEAGGARFEFRTRPEIENEDLRPAEPE